MGTITQDAVTLDINEFRIGQVHEFTPDELKIDPELQVRIVGTSKKDKDKTEKLAQTIVEVGQLQDAGAYPVVNPETNEVEFHLFMGNRRNQAIRLLREQGGDYKLRVRIFAPEEAKDLKRKALIENVHRENYSPVALATQIKAIRAENGWEGAKNWSALVADYLKVSRAQVTQHLRLLDELGPDQIKKIENEGWSAVAAFELLDTLPEKRDEVAEAALVEAKKEKAEKEAKKAKENKQEPVTTHSKKADKEPEPEAEAEVKAKHVRKVARELDANAGPKPLAKSEIIDFFREIAERPDFYGYANSPVRQFATYFTTKYVAGMGKDKTLRDKFDAMIMNENSELYSGIGTPSKAEIREREEQDAADAEAESTKKKKAKK